MRILGDNKAVIEAEIRDNQVRIVTDADKLPQSIPVWLTRDQVRDLVVQLTVLWGEMKKEDEDEQVSDSGAL